MFEQSSGNLLESCYNMAWGGDSAKKRGVQIPCIVKAYLNIRHKALKGNISDEKETVDKADD